MTQTMQLHENEDSEATPPVRVLLVEDDRDLRQSLAEYLRLRGNAVTEAASGLEFYKALRNASFDIAILDVNLPDCSGFDLAAELAPDARRTGIIMLTARTGREDRIRGYGEGADLYMTKPVDGNELLLAIRNLARRLPDIAAVPQAQAAAWKLDLRGYLLITPAERKIDLTAREMQLLTLLAEAGGQPVSRTTLSEAFGFEDRPEARGIDAITQRLKQKAASIDVDLPMKTIRSVGISFAADLEIH
ncbi:response regulator transcription factor [Martelella sp. HB161492]|uniref:response regulator transcription factor n=1 Tax=Martelella sp. HB161492 TaxID=2720726 RepID=UPI001592AC6F|nr:response regulator transcription factor [Martelella sp. HB161492]